MQQSAFQNISTCNQAQAACCNRYSVTCCARLHHCSILRIRQRLPLSSFKHHLLTAKLAKSFTETRGHFHCKWTASKTRPGPHFSYKATSAVEVISLLRSRTSQGCSKIEAVWTNYWRNLGHGSLKALGLAKLRILSGQYCGAIVLALCWTLMGTPTSAQELVSLGSLFYTVPYI